MKKASDHRERAGHKEVDGNNHQIGVQNTFQIKEQLQEMDRLMNGMCIAHSLLLVKLKN